MVLTLEERVFLVEHVFREGNKYTESVQKQFADKFPETPIPHRNSIRKLIRKFRETGSVADNERSGRPLKLNDEKLLAISDSLLKNPGKSLRELAQEQGIGLGTVHTAIRKKLKEFKPR